MYSLFDKEFFVFGHRGYSDKYPENTMLSFSKCVDLEGVDGIELDVHRCRSGEIVVAHDGNLKRVAGIDRFIEDMTWDELKDIDVGSFKSPEFSSCRMPLLEELFEAFGARFIYDIEIKVEKGRKYKKLCKDVWSLICEYNLQEQVVVTSFHPFALRFFNKISWMSVPTADIYDNSNPVKGRLLQKLSVGEGRRISNSYFSKPNFGQVTEQYARDLNRPIICWTVNTEEDARRLVGIEGVRGLIGNDPQLLSRVVSEK